MPRVVVQVVKHYPHDPDAFTQGLIIHGDTLLESTGLKGHSSLREVALETGHVKKQTDLPATLFGEGLARVGNRLIQLTWKAGVGLIYETGSLSHEGVFSYSGQGWGLAFDGTHLVMSNGSNVLQFLDPGTFEVVGRVKVRTAAGLSVDKLNELEYINGEIWANIRFSDILVRIDPDSGLVIGYVDARALRAMLPAGHEAGVLNGIAWDEESNRLFLTGKYWPWLFQVTVPGVLPADAPDALQSSKNGQ